MSVITADWSRPSSLRRFILQAGAAALATAFVVSGLTVLVWFILSTNVMPTVTPRNPFGLTLREVAPNTSGISGFMLMLQAQFYTALTGTVQAIKSGEAATASLAIIGFFYGIFHAAGPGHGKGVIAAYIFANNRSISRGLMLSTSAALLQATVAVGIVSILSFVVHATATSINATARSIEIVSFLGIAVVGLLLVWWKAGELVRVFAGDSDAAFGNAKDRLRFARRSSWPETFGVIAAAGIRPCTGALLLLVFAESQELYVAGVIGAYAMAVGTAITTGSLATVAVFAKAALRNVTDGILGLKFIAVFELIAASCVLVLGGCLLTGMFAGGLPSFLD